MACVSGNEGDGHGQQREVLRQSCSARQKRDALVRLSLLSLSWPQQARPPLVGDNAEVDVGARRQDVAAIADDRLEHRGDPPFLILAILSRLDRSICSRWLYLNLRAMPRASRNSVSFGPRLRYFWDPSPLIRRHVGHLPVERSRTPYTSRPRCYARP